MNTPTYLKKLGRYALYSVCILLCDSAFAIGEGSTAMPGTSSGGLSQSAASALYCAKTGCTMTGDINMSGAHDLTDVWGVIAVWASITNLHMSGDIDLDSNDLLNADAIGAATLTCSSDALVLGNTSMTTLHMAGTTDHDGYTTYWDEDGDTMLESNRATGGADNVLHWRVGGASFASMTTTALAMADGIAVTTEPGSTLLIGDSSIGAIELHAGDASWALKLSAGSISAGEILNMGSKRIYSASASLDIGASCVPVNTSDATTNTCIAADVELPTGDLWVSAGDLVALGNASFTTVHMAGTTDYDGYSEILDTDGDSYWTYDRGAGGADDVAALHMGGVFLASATKTHMEFGLPVMVQSGAVGPGLTSAAGNWIKIGDNQITSVAIFGGGANYDLKIDGTTIEAVDKVDKKASHVYSSTQALELGGNCGGDMVNVSNASGNVCFDGDNEYTVGDLWISLGDLAVPKGSISASPFVRHVDLPPGVALLGPTAPSTNSQGTFRTLGFDANNEEAFFSWEVPDDWIGTAHALQDLTFKTYWTNTATDAVADTEDIDFSVEYRSIDVDGGELYDNGNSTTATDTYLQSGPGTDKATHESEITISADDGDNPIVAGEVLGIMFIRDVNAEANSYSGELRVIRWEIGYWSTTFAKH